MRELSHWYLSNIYKILFFYIQFYFNALPGCHYHYQTCNPKGSIPVTVPILRQLLDIENDVKGINNDDLQKKK
jgi:hypothetical protein